MAGFTSDKHGGVVGIGNNVASSIIVAPVESGLRY